MTKWLALVLLLAVGCASTQSTDVRLTSQSNEVSPVADESQSEAKKVKPIPFRQLQLPESEVQLTAQLADSDMRGPLPWHQALVKSSETSSSRTTEGLRCLAADLAQYISKQDVLPPPSILRQLELRCGAKGIGTDIQFEVAEVTEPLPGPAQLWEMWQGVLEALVARSSEGGSKASVFGISIYVASPKTVAVVTRQEQPYDLRLDTDDDQGPNTIVIEGKFHEMVDSVALVATQGALGFQVCERDMTKALPSFLFRCSAEPDTTVVAELFSRKPGRRMSNLDARFLLSHQENLSRSPGRVIDLTALEDSHVAVAGPQWLSRLNTLRTQQALKLLQFEPEESRVINKAMPSYLEALSDPAKGRQVETMALAMLAGWHAEVPVIGGAMTTKLVESTDPDEWLSVVLSEPSARMVLMNPDASHIAGAFLEVEDSEGRGLSGLVVTYETLDPAYRDQIISKLRQRWSLHGRGSSEPTDSKMDQRTALIGQAERGEVDRPALLDGLLDLYALHMQCEVRVTIVETIELGSLEIPDWLDGFDGTVLMDIAFMGRSTSTARTQWVVVIGLPSDCRK